MASIFVRGFDFGTSELEVKNHCKRAGLVTSVEMQGKGSAVVTYAQPAHAEKAVDTLNQTTIGGNSRYIDVKLNEETKGKKRGHSDGPSCRVFVRGFDFGTTDEQFEAHMGQAGTIETVHWCTKGSAIAIYSSPDEAAEAVSTLQGTTIEGNSRFIDVILKEAEDQGPPAKRFRGGKGGGKGGGKAKGAVAAPGGGMWLFVPPAFAAAAKGKGSSSKGKRSSAGKAMSASRSPDPAGSGRVFVRGFDFGTSDEQLMAHMKRAGPIADVHWATKGSAVVVYSKATSANKAVNILNQSTIAGNSRFIDVLLKDSE